MEVALIVAIVALGGLLVKLLKLTPDNTKSIAMAAHEAVGTIKVVLEEVRDESKNLRKEATALRISNAECEARVVRLDAMLQAQRQMLTWFEAQSELTQEMLLRLRRIEDYR